MPFHLLSGEGVDILAFYLIVQTVACKALLLSVSFLLELSFSSSLLMFLHHGLPSVLYVYISHMKHSTSWAVRFVFFNLKEKSYKWRMLRLFLFISIRTWWDSDTNLLVNRNWKLLVYPFLPYSFRRATTTIVPMIPIQFLIILLVNNYQTIYCSIFVLSWNLHTWNCTVCFLLWICLFYNKFMA